MNEQAGGRINELTVECHSGSSYTPVRAANVCGPPAATRLRLTHLSARSARPSALKSAAQDGTITSAHQKVMTSR